MQKASSHPKRRVAGGALDGLATAGLRPLQGHHNRRLLQECAPLKRRVQDG